MLDYTVDAADALAPFSRRASAPSNASVTPEQETAAAVTTSVVDPSDSIESSSNKKRKRGRTATACKVRVDGKHAESPSPAIDKTSS